MFFKTNKCIFIGVRTKAFTMQSKNKIGAWAHMRPPLYLYCSRIEQFWISDPHAAQFGRGGVFLSYENLPFAKGTFLSRKEPSFRYIAITVLTYTGYSDFSCVLCDFHFCIIGWFPADKKSILEKQVTRTPLRGVTGYLHFHY